MGVETGTDCNQLCQNATPFCQKLHHSNLAYFSANNRVYSCGDGKEIPYWQTCNKFPDCADGRDEWAEEMQCDDIVTGQLIS